MQHTITVFDDNGFELLVTITLESAGIRIDCVEFVIGGESVNITNSLNKRQREFIVDKFTAEF